MWTYSQSTGDVEDKDGKFLERGYSGQPPEGRNNPAMQTAHNIGPIPQGIWVMDMLFDSDSHGPRCIRLEPQQGTVTYGRSGFLIHGERVPPSLPGFASHGCIILSRKARLFMWDSEDTQIRVVP